jgi:hypothetical protein
MALTARSPLAEESLPAPSVPRLAEIALFADLDGKGVPDLVVGEFSLGRVRVYKNIGKSGAPVFDTHEPIRASGEPACTEPG